MKKSSQRNVRLIWNDPAGNMKLAKFHKANMDQWTGDNSEMMVFSVELF